MDSVRVVAAAGLSALAAWSFRPVFESGAGLVVTLAVVAPAVVVAGWDLLSTSVLKRLSGGTASALALLWVLVAVAAITQPGLDVLSGPFRLLTSTLPTEAAAPQLAAVSLLSGLTALTAVHLAAKNALLPVLPALVCLGLGLSLGAAVAPMPVWYVPAFVIVATVPAFLRGRATRTHLIAGIVVLAPAIVAAVVYPLVSPVASRPPASAQALIDAPVQPKRHTNPMAQYLALRDGRHVLRIEGTGSERVDRLGMVTLTEFDGRAWSPASVYRRAAHELPAPPSSTAPLRSVTLDLRVLTPGGVGWLPRPGWPEQVSVAGLGFAADTGDIVVPADRETPMEYRISASEPVVSPDLLKTDQPAASADRPDLVLPPDVLAFVDAATAGQYTELDRFLGLYHNLRAEPFHYDATEEAPGGNGVYQISALLKNHRGTSEQYAAAFATMCRQLGWEARVVLGFEPRWNGDVMLVEGRDVSAWVEVRFEQLGWLPVDPSPTRNAPRGDEKTAAPAEGPASGTVQLPPAHDPVPESEAAVPSAVDQPSEDESQSSFVVPAVVGTGLLVLVILAVPLLKAIRLRPRRRMPAPQRILEAWRDVVLVLRAGGTAVQEHQTTGQVVEAASPRCKAALHSLAELTDSAAFGPDEVTEESATAAVRLRDEVRMRVRGELSFWRRAAWLFDPRPLVTTRRPAEYNDLTISVHRQ